MTKVWTSRRNAKRSARNLASRLSNIFVAQDRTRVLMDHAAVVARTRGGSAGVSPCHLLSDLIHSRGEDGEQVDRPPTVPGYRRGSALGPVHIPNAPQSTSD